MVRRRASSAPSRGAYVQARKAAHERRRRAEGQAAGVPLGDAGSVPLLRPPRRRATRPATTQLGPAASLGRPQHRPGLRGQGRLAHVPRRRGARLPAAPAPRLRDGDHRAARAHRSLGLAGRRRRASARGDVQWLTAGKGIVHSEMFPLLDARRPEPARAVPDLAEPAERRQARRAALRDAVGRDDPARARRDAAGGRPRSPSSRASSATRRPPPPPPQSWAARPDTDVAIWTIKLAPGARWTLPPRRAGHATARSTSSAAARCASAGRAVAGSTAVGRCAPRSTCALENGAERERAAAAAGPADRRAGRAVRAVRDEHARRDPAGVRSTTSARSSAAGPGRATTRCTRATRAASPATPTAASSGSADPRLNKYNGAGNYRVCR